MRAYARKRFHDEMVKAWLDRVFSESIEDPVKVAVAETVKAFGQDIFPREEKSEIFLEACKQRAESMSATKKPKRVVALNRVFGDY